MQETIYAMYSTKRQNLLCRALTLKSWKV